MKSADIMSRPVLWVSPRDTLKDASKKMAEHNIGDLPVCHDDRLLGIITDRDIVVRACAKGLDLSVTCVEEIMTKGVEWCFEDDDLEKIIGRMEEKCIQRMIVIDHNKKLIGVISLGDIAVRGDERIAAEALHNISELRRGRRLV